MLGELIEAYAPDSKAKPQDVNKVEVMKSAKVRRAKLYYLRDLRGKAARMKDIVK